MYCLYFTIVFVNEFDARSFYDDLEKDFSPLIQSRNTVSCSIVRFDCYGSAVSYWSNIFCKLCAEIPGKFEVVCQKINLVKSLPC